MADARKARPVSGEIMTDDARDTSAQTSWGDRNDIIDADFEVLAPASASVESPEHKLSFEHQDRSAGGMDMLRAARPRDAMGGARAGPVFWLAGISLAAMVFWISGGHAVVRAVALPFAAPANALRLAEISSRVEAAGQKTLLLVEGVAINDGHDIAILPPIDIVVAAQDGKILRYRLGTAASQVASGARWDFSSRLDLPMNGIKAVKVAFSE